jgi:hypothetical protein
MKRKYLFFITVILLISIGVFVYYKVFSSPISKQYDFINLILEKGGRVTLPSEREDGKEPELIYNQFTKKNIDEVHALAVDNNKITETDIVNIPPLKKLKRLYFNNTELTADIFRRLETTELEFLLFRCGYLPDQLIFSRGQLNRIGDLAIYQMKMSNNIFKKWDGLSINRLNVMQTQGISEVGLKYLLPQNHLESASFWYTSITDNITEFFNGCPELKTIEIVGGNLRCDFIRDMKWTDKIETIDITETNLDDEILNSITRFKKLNKLRAINCQITEKSKLLLEDLGKKMYLISVYSENGTIFQQINSDNYYNNLTPEELEEKFEKE